MIRVIPRRGIDLAPGAGKYLRVDDASILELSPPPADARIAYGADGNQFGDLRLPKSAGPHPVVVNIHGGFWRARYSLAHAGHLCAALTQAGMATWNLEYRRVGDTGGGWPGSFEDVTQGFLFLEELARRFPLDLKRAVIMGHSAGGQLALILAAHQQQGRGPQPARDGKEVRGAVSLAGVVDLRRAWELKLSNDAVGEFLGGAPDNVGEHYREASPIEVPMPKLRQRLLHGAADTIVPIDFSRRYTTRKRATHEDAKLVELASAGHFDLIDPRSAAWKAVERTVRELLI